MLVEQHVLDGFKAPLADNDYFRRKERTMRTRIMILTVLGLLLASTGEAMASQAAQIQCLITPRQAEAVPIRTNWNATVRWRASTYSVGRQYQKDFVVRSDGYFEWPFARPPKGFTLQGTIRIHGGWAYHDCVLTIIWDGSSREPEIHVSKNAKIWSNGRYRDTVRYGAQFNMKRK